MSSVLTLQSVLFTVCTAGFDTIIPVFCPHGMFWVALVIVTVDNFIQLHQWIFSVRYEIKL